MLSIYKPINQRNEKQADHQTHHHGAYHSDGQRTLQLRTDVRGEQQRHHGEYRREGGHDDGPQAPVTRRVDEYLKANPLEDGITTK